MKRLLLLAFASLLLWAAPASAQITIPYTFSAGTDILSAEVNSNFSTLSTSALKRDGSGVLTGNLTVSGGITIDGADVGAFLSGTTQLTVPTGGTFIAEGVTYHWPASGGSSTYVLKTDGSGNIAWNDLATLLSTKTVSNLGLTNYNETKATGSISAGTLAVDLANGNHFAVALNANVSTFTVANVPASGKAAAVTFLFTADGTPRTIVWPSGIKWADATAPTMTSTSTKVDIVTLYTVDGGTTWYGMVGGQNF